LGTGAVTINSGATLAGTGIVADAVTLADGGTLSPGSGIGTLTVNNDVNVATGATLAVDVNKSNSTNDLLTITGKLTMSGKIKMTNIGGPSFVNGDAFKIISGTVIGTPTEIIPAVPGDGLVWDLSEFTTNGTIKVVTSTGLHEYPINSKVYPNPFNDKLSISLEQQLDEAQVSIVNMLGEIVYNSSFVNTSRINLKLNYLNNGVYLLQVKAGDKLTIQKIVKE